MSRNICFGVEHAIPNLRAQPNSQNHMHLKQSAEPWPNLVVAMTRNVVIPLALVIPEAPFVYGCSHKDLSVLALREESF
jgi:hypothetical protein